MEDATEGDSFDAAPPDWPLNEAQPAASCMTRISKQNFINRIILSVPSFQWFARKASSQFLPFRPFRENVNSNRTAPDQNEERARISLSRQTLATVRTSPLEARCPKQRPGRRTWTGSAHLLSRWRFALQSLSRLRTKPAPSIGPRPDSG